MKIKFTKDDIFSDLDSIADDYNIYHRKDQINAYNNKFHHENDAYGYIELKCTNNSVKVIDGFGLRDNEGLVWKFKDFEDLRDLTREIDYFLKSYFNSFVVVRKK